MYLSGDTAGATHPGTRELTESGSRERLVKETRNRDSNSTIICEI
jgi:hypothetical protein